MESEAGGQAEGAAGVELVEGGVEAERLEWNGEEWTKGPGRGSAVLPVGIGLALFAAAVVVPLAAAGVTWLVLTRGRS